MVHRYTALGLMMCVMLTACGTAVTETAETSGTAETAETTVTTVTSPPVTTTAETTTTEVTYETIYDDSGAFSYAGELVEKGDDDSGYIQIPADFVRFEDASAEGVLQYSDRTGKNIVTLRRNIGTDFQSAAQNLLSYMDKEHDIDGLTAASLKVGGYDAIQIYGGYPDGYFLVIWLIEDPDAPTDSYYLSMEFDASHQYLMACSSTFRTAGDANAAFTETSR
ncbi:MAG: hypothetical protein J6I96_00275 [Oscillospiraceae bacterium]|nr:hypothetical protein [Oscillospiraceae bacterium]